MSGPKVSTYDLDQARKRRIEQQARERQRRIEEEIMERQRRIEAQMRKVQQEVDAKKRAADDMMNSVNRMMEEEQRKQREREQQRQKEMASISVQTRKGILSEQDIPKAVNFDDLLAKATKEMEEIEGPKPDMEAILKELEQEPVELRSLIDTYIPKVADEDTAQTAGESPDSQKQEFDELLLNMEREYQEIVQDRAFFKQQRDRIVHFEEVCKRQQEYRSYQILRGVYYGEFQKLKKARESWHKEYDKWKSVFDEAYIQYRASCEMLDIEPEHHFLKVETAKEEIDGLRAETMRLQQEYLRRQEALEITTALNEVMEEMGYQVLGTKSIAKKSGGKVQNTVFSFGEGSGIHVMDSGERITMEVVGIDDGSQPITEEEKDYLAEEQEYFCDSFREIEEALKKKGVVVKNRIKMNAPSREFSAIMNMEGYSMTEESKTVKKLAKVDKKAKRKQQGQSKKYLSE